MGAEGAFHESRYCDSNTNRRMNALIRSREPYETNVSSRENREMAKTS